MARLEHGKNLSEQGKLTGWKAQMDRKVRAWKEFEQGRKTYFLMSTDRWTSQNMERTKLTRVTHLLKSTNGWIGQDTERI
jgi:hypothetical protein